MLTGTYLGVADCRRDSGGSDPTWWNSSGL